MATTHEQLPGHMYGPPPPHIAFFYGRQYLGETRGHPDDIETAQDTLWRHTNVLFPSWEGQSLCARIRLATRAVLICGRTHIELHS